MSIDIQPAAQATEALIHQYGRLVFQVIYGLTGDWHESQDLTQDTFVQAFKAIEAARQASGANFHAKAWLMQIAANNARMSLRRRRLVRFVPFAALRKEEQDDDELVGGRPVLVQPAGYGIDGVVQDPADLIAERDLVQWTIAQLPEALRLCLVLSVVGGLPSHEVARALNLGEAAVRQRLSRARKLFQQIYLRESGDFIAAASTFGVPTFFPPKIQASLGWLTAPMSHRSAKKPPLVTF
jgi:RNA polymerase sigma factor (sigma-70 family)